MANLKKENKKQIINTKTYKKLKFIKINKFNSLKSIIKNT